MDLSIQDYKNLTVEYLRDNWIRIPQINFYGQGITSENGRYTLAWMRGRTISDQRGRKPYNEKGAYVLFDKTEIILIDYLENPEKVNVANNGTFLVNDNLFSTALKSVFYAIDRQGNILINHKFKALLNSNGISPNGRFAVCQTCNSRNKDGNSLCFFDLYQRKLMWKKSPETGWADDYEFDVENDILYLRYDTVRITAKYSYKFQKDGGHSRPYNA